MKYIISLILFAPLLSMSSDFEKNIVEKFIDNQYLEHELEYASDDESGQLNSYHMISENLIAIYWTYRVANFWQGRISILKITNSDYEEIDVLKINGIIKNVGYDKNLITITKKDYAESDARCCPSLIVETAYIVTANSIEKYNTPIKQD